MRFAVPLILLFVVACADRSREADGAVALQAATTQAIDWKAVETAIDLAYNLAVQSYSRRS